MKSNLIRCSCLVYGGLLTAALGAVAASPTSGFAGETISFSGALAESFGSVEERPLTGRGGIGSFEALAAPVARKIEGVGDRVVSVDCPCDVHWRSAEGRFSISIDAVAAERTERAADALRISSRLVADMMASVRLDSIRAASVGDGAGRIHIAEDASRLLSIRSDGAWSLVVMTAP